MNSFLKGISVVLATLGLGAFVPQDSVGAPVAPWYPSANANGEPVFAVFENRIPCADCEKVKFALVLYRNPQTNAPTTYLLARVHVAKGDDRTVSAGTWTIARGTKLDPQAIVYRLDSNAPEEFRSYWAVSKDIAFILDQEGNPRVGNASYGYALNRTR